MADELPTLDELLSGCGLTDRAEKIDEHMVRLQYGSAFVIVGTSGSAIVAIAPMFRNLPPGKELAFFQRLLEHNAYMGGMASFALQPDGWVVLHAGRPIKGIDANEFATLVAGVGRFADQFDDKLIAEFYAGDLDAAGATMDPEGNVPEEAPAPADS
jgi:hypothetical protein